MACIHISKSENMYAFTSKVKERYVALFVGPI